MDKKQLEGVLASHKLWLEGNKDGKRADLREVDLFGAELRGADLQGAYLQEADLRKVDLQGAELRGADLRWANLQGANLRGASLCDADLRYVYLSDADLRNADLRNADLRMTNLRGADLREASVDFSCWPLWCGSQSVKVDRRIYLQLLAHLCAIDTDDVECKAHQQESLRLARQSHIANELGLESEDG